MDESMQVFRNPDTTPRMPYTRDPQSDTHQSPDIESYDYRPPKAGILRHLEGCHGGCGVLMRGTVYNVYKGLA